MSPRSGLLEDVVGMGTGGDGARTGPSDSGGDREAVTKFPVVFVIFLDDARGCPLVEPGGETLAGNLLPTGLGECSVGLPGILCKGECGSDEMDDGGDQVK